MFRGKFAVSFHNECSRGSEFNIPFEKNSFFVTAELFIRPASDIFMPEDSPVFRLDDSRSPQSLLDIEESIRFQPIESLYVVNPSDGVVIFSKSGNEDSIFLTDEECLLLEGNIITHNHPFDEHPISASLSEDDVLSAAANKAAEIRAVTPTDKFSIRPPLEGWNLDYCFEVLLPAIETAKPQVEAQMSAELLQGLLSEPEASRIYCHRLWSVLAPQLGLTYESSFSLEQVRQMRHMQQSHVQETTDQQTRPNNVAENDNGDNASFRSMKKSFKAVEEPSKFEVSRSKFNTKEQVVRLEAVAQLSDQDFLLLHRNVVEYFQSSPARPPSPALRQLVQSEINNLARLLNDLWVNQASQVALVESMQLQPFSAWSKKYEEAVKKLETTMKTISASLAQKDQKENQLKAWSKQSETYQKWDHSPRTIEMRSLGFVLNLPQMQERLANIKQEQKRLEQERQAQLKQSKQQQRRLNNQGLSL